MYVYIVLYSMFMYCIASVVCIVLCHVCMCIWCVSMYVCMYICRYVYVYVVCVYVCMHVYMQVCVYMCSIYVYVKSMCKEYFVHITTKWVGSDAITQRYWYHLLLSEQAQLGLDRLHKPRTG